MMKDKLKVTQGYVLRVRGYDEYIVNPTTHTKNINEAKVFNQTQAIRNFAKTFMFKLTDHTIVEVEVETKITPLNKEDIL